MERRPMQHHGNWIQHPTSFTLKIRIIIADPNDAAYTTIAMYELSPISNRCELN